MIKTEYNTNTKLVTIHATHDDYRWFALGIAMASFGPMASHMLQLVTEAAQESHSDDEFKYRVGEVMDHFKSEHGPADGFKQHQLDALTNLQELATALPREVFVGLHEAALGQGDQTSTSA